MGDWGGLKVENGLQPAVGGINRGLYAGEVTGDDEGATKSGYEAHPDVGGF
jgi:hypothetical protein